MIADHFDTPDTSLAARLRARALRFRREEDGVLIGFGVFLILMMLVIGGVGVDIMRFELTRSSLQNTLDRAVLAAADMDQELEPQFVVEDYFSKSSMSEYLASVTVDQGINYKTVSATAEIEMGTQFIHMMGFDTLDAPAAGTAEERVDGVEISMVLDVSGSMTWNSRLPNLKIAAKEFVDLIMDSAREGDVSISLVPYATQVSVPEHMLAKYNVTNEHNHSSCVNFPTEEFGYTAVTQSELLERTGHFDPWERSYDRYYEVDVDDGETLESPVCPTKPEVEVLPISVNRQLIKERIEGLTGGGNTSIEIGVKWGAALLDPSTRPVTNTLISEGLKSPQVADLPRNYNSDRHLKVMVVMTDGENTPQPYLLPASRDGATQVWRDPVSGKYSVKHNSSYYYPHNDSWNSVPYNHTQATQLSYPELWERGPLGWNAIDNWSDVLGGRQSAKSVWMEGKFEWINSNYKDLRLKAICNAAKDRGVVIYAIGFEAPWAGRRVLLDCASSDGHYFDASGVELSDAFAAVASSISKLRLTQ